MTPILVKTDDIRSGRKAKVTLGRQSINMLVVCRLRVDRVAIDISTDALIDVSVKVRYKIHDLTAHLPFMTITSMRKNTRNGSASSRYKSHMALNTSVSHATMKRLRSWKKNKFLH